MTRNRKVDPDVLEREYIYDTANPPVSFTGLAERHGLARNTVAEKALRGRWFERRKEFRESLGVKVTEALGDQWAKLEAATREKLMSLGSTYLDQYLKKLMAEEIPLTTRDALGVASMMRTLMNDAANAKTNQDGEVSLHDPDTVDLSPDAYRRALETIERAERGQLGPGPDDAGEAPPAGVEGPGSD